MLIVSFTHNVSDSGKKYISEEMKINSQGTKKDSSQVMQNGHNNIEFNTVDLWNMLLNYLLFLVFLLC